MIEVRNVYKIFWTPHRIEALVDVSASIQAGEVVVVIGPSGSGKSTFLRCLNHLEAADAGHIFIDGIDVLDPKTDINKVRAEVGMVFQSFNLFPHKTVLENITLAQKVVRKRSTAAALEKADYLLKKVGIHDKANAYPDNLSGGQQQRVAIARALMQEPRLILADEPVASLDPALRHSVMRHIEALNRDEGLTVLCSLHDIDLVERYATRLVALRDGRLVWEGTPSEFDRRRFQEIYGEEAEPASNTGY